MIYLKLFLSFFKIGLFTIGGGMAMLPLLMAETERNGWLSPQQMLDMIAISESTPGPIAINMATFVGYNNAGLPGALVGTFSMVLPSFVITLLVARFFLKFNEHPMVTSVLSFLRPVTTGMIASALAVIAHTTFVLRDAPGWSRFRLGEFYHWINVKPLVLCLILIPAMRKWDFHPILYILAAAAAGIALGF